MTKFAAIGLVIITLGLAGWVVWWWQGNRSTALEEQANVAVAKAKEANEVALVNSGDDRQADREWYEGTLNARVDEVLKGTSEEKSLPTAALPILQARISDGTLAAATTQPLGDALAADGVRLRNALAARKRQEWYRRNFLDIFEKHAEHQRWALPARAAVLAAVRSWSGDYMSTSDEQQIIYREGKKATELGCEEPLLCYVWAQNARDLYYRPGDLEWVAMQGSCAAEQMDKDKSGYPADIKMEADLIAAETLANFKPVPADKKKEIDRLIEEAKGRFGDVINDPEMTRQELTSLFSLLDGTSIAVYGDRRLLPNSLFDQLKASPVDQSTVLTIQGIFNVNYTWDARGNGWSNTVTDEGARLMEERLARADAALEKAWQLDQTNSDAADEMLTVELGQGQGRDRMELWFTRAMTANPDDYQACLSKLYYLEPKWYGSAEEMLKFGRECVAGGNWDAGIPYILAKAHLDLAGYAAMSGNSGGEQQYFRDNPNAWKDMASVCEEFQKHRRMSVNKKLQFARVAAWTRHWDKANEMLDETGGAMDYSIFGDEDYRKFVGEVRSHRAATQPTTQPTRF